MLGAAALSVAKEPAWAQQYPVRDVHLICAFPPGSGADLAVRWYAQRLRPLMGRTIIVENKIGALGDVATEYTARADADGYTIYVHSPSGLAANMHLFKKPPVDIAKELVVAGTINLQPTVLVVRTNAPWDTLERLNSYARENAERVTYGVNQPMAKLVGAIHKHYGELKAVEVNYRSAPDALNDLLSGTIDYGFFDSAFSYAQQRAGKLRMLAISMPERVKAIPDVPTMAEFGIPMKIIGSFGALVRSATPRSIIQDIFVGMFDKITRTDEARDFMQSIASDPWIATQEDAQSFLLDSINTLGRYIDIAKIEKQG